MSLSDCIRDVPDFPKQGIIFKDITPLLADPGALADTIDQLIAPYVDAGVEAVVGVESRGFIFGSLAAAKLGVGFVPIRKPGKLPCKTVSASYELEYGTDTVEMHADAIAPGAKVLMVDDLLATGGTMAAACKLVEDVGGQIVGVAFVIELAFIPGRDKLANYDVHSLLVVESE